MGPVEGGLDVPEEVECQLLGLVLAGDLAVLLVLGCPQRVSKGHLQTEPPHPSPAVTFYYTAYPFLIVNLSLYCVSFLDSHELWRRAMPCASFCSTGDLGVNITGAQLTGPASIVRQL